MICRQGPIARRKSKRIDRGILIADVIAKLTVMTGSAESTASRMITELVDRGYVRKIGITTAEKRALFPNSHGQNTIVTITPDALELLHRINAEASRLIDHLVTGPVERKFLRFAVSQLDSFSDKMVKRLETWKPDEVD